MLKITRDDIRDIDDAASLMDFLREELALPIKADATLEQIARPFPLPYLQLEGTVAAQVIECQELTVRPMDASGTRQPFLIRFREKAEYPGILYHVSEGLQRQGYVLADFGFLCVDEQFRPFAFASFEDAELIIRSWGENKASIHIDTAHEIPADFFPTKRDAPEVVESPLDVPELPVKEVTGPVIVVSPSSAALLAKIENAGTPLRRHWERKRSRIGTGCSVAFIIDELERQEFISADAKNEALLRPVIGQTQIKKWELEMKYLIFIPSGKFKRWPWSGRSESEAEQIFAAEYPAIHAHLNGYGDKVRTRHAGNQGEFYWELPGWREYPEFQLPKLVYRYRFRGFWRAAYDTSGALMLKGTCSIPTPDLSLLALWNSKLLDWYAHAKCESVFNREMMRLPIADCTEAQKAELSELVQRILDSPRNSDVPELETEIDKLTYQLYGITDAERALIEARHPGENAPG